MKKHAMFMILAAAPMLLTACAGEDVTIEVPEYFLSEDAKLLLSDIGLGARGKGYKSRIESEDGTLTYVLTRSQQKKALKEIASDVEERIDDTSGYHHVTQITVNETYSYYTFHTDQSYPGLDDLNTAMEFTHQHLLYPIFLQNKDIDMGLQFVYDKTGEVIWDLNGRNLQTEGTTAAFTTTKPHTTARTTTRPRTTTTAKTTTTVTTTVQPTTENDQTYEHNRYYDIVETDAYQNILGHVVVIQKVLAKQDVSVNGTIIAYAQDGSVLGKSSDTITLTAGQYNYYRYTFDADLADAAFVRSAKLTTDYMTGARNAVELVQYNVSGNYLYLTLRQLDDDLGTFAKYKILFYKDNQLVDNEIGYLSVYAGNLNGKDSTDVIEIPVWGKNFDRIEVMFEP